MSPLKNFKLSNYLDKTTIMVVLSLVVFFIGILFILSNQKVEAESYTENLLHGSPWNPAVGYITSQGVDGNSFTLNLDKLYNDNIFDNFTFDGGTRRKKIRYMRGNIWNPVIGAIYFDSPNGSNYPSTYAFLETEVVSGVETDTYLCGTVWNPSIGYIELTPTDFSNLSLPVCDFSQPTGIDGDDIDRRIMVDIESGAILSGSMWNPQIGFIGMGTDAGGNLAGFDLMPPTITILNDLQSDEFKYISRRFNPFNTLSFETSEVINYTAKVINSRNNIVLKEFSGTLGDLLTGNATSLTWDGSRDNLSPEINYFPNLSSEISSGTMSPSSNFDWHVLENYEKEYVPFFNTESMKETVLDFNGTSDLLEAQQTTELEFDNEGFTLEAWVKPNYLVSDILPIISNESDTDLGNYLLFVNSPQVSTENNLVFQFKETGTSNIISCQTDQNSRWIK